MGTGSLWVAGNQAHVELVFRASPVELCCIAAATTVRCSLHSAIWDAFTGYAFT